MIRKFTDTDINAVSEIWLDINIKAHHFIPAEYWQENFEMVKKMLLQAEIYVYEEADRIKGFIGLDNNYIAGIFVCADAQSKGIGRQLLNYVKSIKPELNLNVYKKNPRAVKFYQRENFRISAENIEKDTNEEEYEMIWQKQSKRLSENSL